MASNQTSLVNTNITIPDQDMEKNQQEEEEFFDYSKRAQWLRAAVLGANDGLVSTASLMIGVSSMNQGFKTMILSGFVGLVSGAFSMAIGEFVSVYSQLDIEMSQIIKREKIRVVKEKLEKHEQEQPLLEKGEKMNNLPNPIQAAGTSAIAFAVGGMVPILAASIVKESNLRLVVVSVAVTMALLLFGWVGAVLGRTPRARAGVRVMLGGWVAMAITLGLTKFAYSSVLMG